ncbi:MAG: cytochrome c family protein [Planctomycetota bacterium]
MARRLGALLFLALPLLSGGAAAAENQYVGVEKCKNCHSATKKGDQYGIWVKGKHAKAVPELATDQAKKYAQAKNVADPHKGAECLKCHVTAYESPAAQKSPKFDPALGVQCESCHGPGGNHVKARLGAEEEGDDTKPVQIAKDEIIAKPTAEDCRKCHNKESPAYKPFAFRKYFKEIAHLDPRKQRPADYVDKIPDDPKDDPEAAKVEFKK